MDDISLNIVIGIGLVSGILGAMFGIGCGVFIVPAFTLLLHIPIHIAIGSSLIAIIANSLTASYYYAKAQLINIKIGLLLELATVPGALVGAFIVVFISSNLLSILFIFILLGIAISMILLQPSGVQNLTNQPNTGKINDYILEPLNMRISNYFDNALNETIVYRVIRILWGLIASFFSGIISSILGVGGGVIKIPVMRQLMCIPIKVAIATSAFMLTITATTGAIIYYYNGYIYPSLVAPLTVGAFVGSIVGSKLAQKVRSKVLELGFVIIVIIIALFMLLQLTKIL